MRGARKLKTKQHDFSDCGAACLVSICRFYGLSVSISHVRSLAGTDEQGTSVMGLLEASKKLGFESKGVKGDQKSLFKVPKPVIAHVVLEDQRHHYIIIYQTGIKMLKIMDPADGRLSSMRWPDFLAKWSGIMILLVPSNTFKKGKKTKSPWKWFWELLKPHRVVLTHAIMGSLLYTILGLSTSMFIRIITDKILVSGDLTLLNTIGIAMVIILLFQILLSVFKDVFIIRMGQEIDARLILGYQEHLFGLPFRFFDTMKIGEIISRVGDAVKIRVFISQTVMSLFINLLIIVFSYVLILHYNWKIGVLLLSMIPLYALVFFITDVLNKKSERQLMEASAKLESHLVETLQGIRTLKLFGAESFVLKKSEFKFLSVLKAGYRSSLNTVFSRNSSFCLQNLFTTGLLWLGSVYVLNSELTTGELLSIFAILGYLTSPLASFVSSNRDIQNAIVASDRLFDLTGNEDDSGADGISISNIQIRDISFNEIDFQYKPGIKILQKFSVRIEAGEIIAIKGRSGCGKSTLLALMQKVYPVQKGSIKIGGTDIKYISNSCLKRTFACVPQKIELFSGTIIENIALGDPCVDLQRVIDIVALLEMEDFIDRFPNGLHTFIGEGGANLSGGQKQRIAIARALYRQPQILLLDEPSSSLDLQSERSIIRAMKNMKEQGKTVIVVSHRDSTLSESDRILIMEKGKLKEEFRTHNSSQINEYIKTD